MARWKCGSRGGRRTSKKTVVQNCGAHRLRVFRDFTDSFCANRPEGFRRRRWQQIEVFGQNFGRYFCRNGANPGSFNATWRKSRNAVRENDQQGERAQTERKRPCVGDAPLTGCQMDLPRHFKSASTYSIHPVPNDQARQAKLSLAHLPVRARPGSMVIAGRKPQCSHWNSAYRRAHRLA